MASEAIGRENLKKHGIYYHADVYTDTEGVLFKVTSLPDHVNNLRQQLLELVDIVPGSWKGKFEDECSSLNYGGPSLGSLCPTEAAYIAPRRFELRERDPEKPSPISQAERYIKDCEGIAVLVRKQTKSGEDDWVAFLRRYIFQKFEELGDNRTKIDLLFDEWDIQQNVLWTSCTDGEESAFSSAAVRRTKPKPDLCYGFKMSCPTDEPVQGFAQDEYINSFSFKSLRELSENGINCTVTEGLLKWPKSQKEKLEGLSNRHKLCFPWTVIEMKHDKADPAEIKMCYCQAANAAASALRLQENLFRRAAVFDLKTLPPVIAFTCIGPQIKLWLAYNSTKFGKPIIEMSCIWSNTIELTWGVISLRQIVKTMHIWSSRILRPRLAIAIRLVRDKLWNTSRAQENALPDLSHLFLTSDSTEPSSQSPQNTTTKPLFTFTHHRSRSSVTASVSPAPETFLLSQDVVAGDARETYAVNSSIGARDRGDEMSEAGTKHKPSSSDDYETTDESDVNFEDSGSDEMPRFGSMLSSSNTEISTSSGITNTADDVVESSCYDVNDEMDCQKKLTIRIPDHIHGPYDSLEGSETESEDQSSSDSEFADELFDPRRVPQYSEEEELQRSRYSLTLLSGAEFARLEGFLHWSEHLTHREQVGVTWRLIDIANGGLVQSAKFELELVQLSDQLDILNQALGRHETRTPLTSERLRNPRFESRIRKGLRSLNKETLTRFMDDCLILHNDKKKSVYRILAEDLEMLPKASFEAMARESFSMLFERDQRSDMLR